jgi:hypothetical protein
MREGKGLKEFRPLLNLSYLSYPEIYSSKVENWMQVLTSIVYTLFLLAQYNYTIGPRRIRIFESDHLREEIS